MNKRTLTLLLCVAFVAAACGNAQTTTTTAPATTTPAPSADPADVAAIENVYAVVFDSTTTFDQKAPFIDDPTGLEDTVARYTASGAAVGGVTAEVTDVGVDGDQGDVEYTLKFSGNPTYPGQKGTAVRNSGTWQVTRAMFCSVMASARSACPG